MTHARAFRREQTARREKRRHSVYADYASTPAKTRHRVGRDGYYSAVRDDLALPPGLAVRWQLPSVDQP
ncbi:hypothetical protein HLK59_06940 [Streptomyces sp. S3(2020)]|uniref:hypothetical protein n=1 Tax=Streptomyces sp. S3(2020) TaxID=2732044 RepID=UPI00148913F9|nr:hypothetical protein [Streptomyces sp. S3(2020)]NNN30101.1 hypothetical protein [Streptomyces sp. S3(2020)]